MRLAEEFRLLVLEAVHRLRVDPHDQGTRDQLSDLFEERGLPESLDRTVRPLREGKIVVNSLDARACSELWMLAGSGRFGRGRGSRDAQYVRDHFFRLMSGSDPRMTPPEYEYLWTLAHRYRRQVEDKEVKSEAEEVHRERQELERTSVVKVEIERVAV